MDCVESWLLRFCCGYQQVTEKEVYAIVANANQEDDRNGKKKSNTESKEEIEWKSVSAQLLQDLDTDRFAKMSWKSACVDGQEGNAVDRALSNDVCEQRCQDIVLRVLALHPSYGR